MNHTLPRLIAMANQIARAFARLPEDKAVTEVANHLKSFWEQRMLRQIFEYAATGGEALSPVARAAVTSLRRRETSPA
ncbi:MAG: formate dehydrogenase subunit delta [Acidocella sp.]|nr:formate dehydrogenase subunit delta [Acidocella sp.]